MWTYAGKSLALNIKYSITQKGYLMTYKVFQQALNNKMPLKHEVSRLHENLYIGD